MFPPMLSESLRVRSGVKKYLGPREHVIYATRRHPVVLSSAVAVWLIGLVLGLAAGLSYSAGGGNAQLSWAGAAVVLAGAAFFGWRAWQWRMARYVLTSERVLHIEGILSRRVNGLPLRSVLDTTYHRTLAGRIFGYGNLELNLSGQPGL